MMAKLIYAILAVSLTCFVVSIGIKLILGANAVILGIGPNGFLKAGAMLLLIDINLALIEVIKKK